jgi:hypothetical protein
MLRGFREKIRNKAFANLMLSFAGLYSCELCTVCDCPFISFTRLPSILLVGDGIDRIAKLAKISCLNE